MAWWFWASRACVAGLATGLFPPQQRDWNLPAAVPLSPKAYGRLTREAIVQAFAKAAQALNEDWGSAYDGRQVQRWAQKAGEELLAQQAARSKPMNRVGIPWDPRTIRSCW